MAFAAPLVGALGGLGGAASAASGLLGILSGVGNAMYQAKVASNNAEIARDNAKIASDAAQAEGQKSDIETAALIGQQEAIQAASGLSTTGASQLRTRRTAQKIGRQDTMNIRAAGDRNIRNYMQQSADFAAEARNQKAQIPGIIIGGALDTMSGLSGMKGSTLVTGARTTRMANRIDPWAGLRRATV